MDDRGLTPLCIACLHGDAQVAGALLDNGANIHFATPPRDKLLVVPGFTPLMFAASGNHAAIVKLLLQRGADSTQTTTETARTVDAGSTAVDIARLRSNHGADFAATLAVLRMSA